MTFAQMSLALVSLNYQSSPRCHGLTRQSTHHNILLRLDRNVRLVGQAALERLVQVNGGRSVVNIVRPSATDLGKFLQIFVGTGSGNGNLTVQHASSC